MGKKIFSFMVLAILLLFAPSIGITTIDASEIPEEFSETDAADTQVSENELPAPEENISPLSEETDKICNLSAVPVGNCMIRLTWTYTSSQLSSDSFQYLIYRSDSEAGTYTKIGYTPKGVTEYTDAGGDYSLTENTTYYYKIQAYAPDENVSTNLTSADIVSATTESQVQAENEFILEDQKENAVNYLKSGLINRESEIVLNIWLNSSKISGYSTVLFDEAVKETEDVSAYNEGDYLWFHLTGYDCQLTDTRITRNGLTLYTLTYTPTYYSTAEEETELSAKVDNIIKNDLDISADMDDFEKVRKVYEYLSLDATYDLSLRENGLSRCSAYNAIVEKRAVCQGYSNAVFYILKKLGINNRIITGNVYYDGEWRVHAWNLVEINDAWYNVCVTTEVHMREDYNILSYRYLLKTDNDQYFSIFQRDSAFSDAAFTSAHPMAQTSYQVTVADAALQIPTLTAAPKSGVTMTLSWNSVSNASYYEIYRSTSADGAYTKIKATTGTSTSDTNLSAGTRYYYKIRTIRDQDGVTYLGNFSDTVAAVTLATPTITDVSLSGTGITISWSKASGADRYNIYRSESATGSYTYLTSVLGSLNYTDAAVQTGKTYYYKVRPYKKLDGIVYYGGYSAAQKYEIVPMASLTTTAKSGVTISLSWSKFADASSYEIWVSSTADGPFEKLKETTGTTTSHTGLIAGTRYFYRICAKKGQNIIGLSSTKACVALATPSITNITQLPNGLIVNWSKASGADRYNIYRSTEKDGPYTYIASIQQSESYTDTALDSGNTYYYKVRAYKKYDGIVYYGGYSTVDSCYFIEAPVITAIPKSGITMSLSWTGSVELKYYEIYYSSTENGTYSFLKTTTGTATSHTGLTAGSRYWYKIRGYFIKDGTIHYSAYSAPIAAVALAAPTIQSVTQKDNGTFIEWSKASGADRYNIYRSDSATGTYTYITSVQGATSYLDEDAAGGYYKIRAYKKYDGIVYYGNYSAASN